MNREIKALSSQQFDILVIGGGIFGAGIARDAALRGLRVALIDKADFASGTSSRSSKLIHGGFRYLQQRAFGLVAEACRERQILARIAPHLVHPQPFLLPVYENAKHSMAKLRLGMTLYDLIAFHRSPGRHRRLPPERARLKEPALARQGLRGAILYHDCTQDDARLCLDNLLHAADCGAVCANYCELTGFVSRNDRLAAAQVRDRLGSHTFEISARVFVNAAGPWLDRVTGLAPFGSQRPTLQPTKGVHLLLPALSRQHAVVFEARRDGRFLFVIPWGQCSIVGTTDTDYAGDPDAVRAEHSDIEYLLSEVRSVFPDTPISEGDIITTFAGVRALLRSDVAEPSARSRQHRILRSGQNMLSIAGGKYTTYRAIAEQTVNQVYKLLGAPTPPCRTADTPLPPQRPAPSGEQICASPAVYASDIAHACQHEMAVTVSDVMRRRTQLALSRHGGPQTARTVALHMARHLGWSDDQMHAQLQNYLDEWKRSLP